MSEPPKERAPQPDTAPVSYTHLINCPLLKSLYHGCGISQSRIIIIRRFQGTAAIFIDIVYHSSVSYTHLTFQAVFRVRSLVAYAIHQYFQERDFVYVHTPLITGSDCEGAGEMFQVTTMDLNNIPKTEEGKVDFSQDFFGKATNLTVSGQLNAETYAMAFRNVYTFGPTFRAENSNRCV